MSIFKYLPKSKISRNWCLKKGHEKNNKKSRNLWGMKIGQSQERKFKYPVSDYLINVRAKKRENRAEIWEKREHGQSAENGLNF